MAVPVSVRFEVIKRDRYTCTYCGKHPPEVLLEVDHIVPRAAGGSDDIGNLTTACTDCNRGKGARLLEEGTAPVINRSAVAEMQERIEQAKLYMELLGGLETITDEQVSRVTEAWARAFKAELVERDGVVQYWLEGGAWPDERSVRQFIKKIGLEQVLDAVDIAASRVWYDSNQAVRYFYGICHRSIKQGREPLLTREAVDQEATDAYFEGYTDGKEIGTDAENRRIRDLFLNREEHGFETFADVVQSLWPEND